MFGSRYPRGTSFWFSEGIVVSRSSWCTWCVFSVFFFRLDIIIPVDNDSLFVLFVLKYFFHYGLGYRWRIWTGKYGLLPLVFIYEVFVVVFPMHIQFSETSSLVKLSIGFSCQR